MVEKMSQAYELGATLTLVGSAIFAGSTLTARDVEQDALAQGNFAMASEYRSEAHRDGLVSFVLFLGSASMAGLAVGQRRLSVTATTPQNLNAQ